MGIASALFAGFFNSLTNFCVKKGVDIRGHAKLFFLCQILASGFFALIFGPVVKGNFVIPLYPALLGICSGVVLYVMLFALGLAVEKGSSSLTFAILNSATILPGILMAVLFGSSYGFAINLAHIIGLLLVIVGLFWGINSTQQTSEKAIWSLFVAIVFLCHVFLLCLFHYRAMLIRVLDVKVFDSEWFTPFMFFTCSSIQLIAYFYSSYKFPSTKEVVIGVAGGLTNLFCTFSLLLATKKASSIENAVIFPIASVAGIIFTNLWSQKLYSEQINWKACQLLVFGIIVGTINWKVVVSKVGELLCLAVLQKSLGRT